MGGSSGKLFEFNELVRKKEDQDAIDLFKKAKLNPNSHPRGGKPLLEQACFYGRTDVVSAILEGKKKLETHTLDFALLANCQEATNLDIVTMLIGKGASANAMDSDMDTPLIAVCRKNSETPVDLLVERRKVAKFLISKGAKFDSKNYDKLNPIQMACSCEHEKMAILLVQGGAKISDVQSWRQLNERNGKNWVAGSVMCKYAFKDAAYLENMKKEFMSRFDQDKNGQLDKSELVRFLAYHLKVQFDAGVLPRHGIGFEVHEGMGIDDIEDQLKRKGKKLIARYSGAYDADGGGTLSWDELLPVVQDFYSNLWQQDRPEQVNEGTDQIVDPMPVNASKGSSSAAASATAAGSAGPRPLPLNWYEVPNPNATGPHDQVYYAHAVTHETTWIRPA